MPKAPEAEFATLLESDTTFMASLKAVYGSTVPRTIKTPFVVVSLLGDSNDKEFLSYWGGSAQLQLDIYSKDAADYELRAIVKGAARRIRGVSGGLKITSAVVRDEKTWGLEETGLYRWSVDIEVNYTEE